MDKTVVVLTFLAHACQGRRVQISMVGRASAQVLTSRNRAPPVMGPLWASRSPVVAPSSAWDIKAISRKFKRLEGLSRQAWSFDDMSRNRVSVAVCSEGRPAHASIDLWIGPDWSPFNLKAYSENGKLRPMQVLVGTRNQCSHIDIWNTGSGDFPITAAAAYATDEMAAVAQRPKGEMCQGSSIRSYQLSPNAKMVEVCLRTDGKQLNAKVELLNAPNNPKQKYQVFTNDGELNSLCMCFNTPDELTTLRIQNEATMEFPLYIKIDEIS